MADNKQLPATGTGTADIVVATDEITGTDWQKLKIGDGVADSTVMLHVVAEDEALTGGETGILSYGIRTATPANTSGADGDAELLQINDGKLWVANLGFLVPVQTTITRPADTAVYAAGDAISDSTSAPTSGGFTFTNAARKSGGAGIIKAAIFTTDNDPATRLSAELHLFDRAVTNINDNTAYAVTDAEIKTGMGVIPFSMFDAGNNGMAHVVGLEIPFVCNGSANLRFLYRARNAYTPANAET